MTTYRRFHTCLSNLAKNIPKNAKGASSNKWLLRQLSDPFVEQAKMFNYRCRSAFKLLEINEKANIFQPGQVVVDCGASPGSWTQIAVDKTNANGAAKGKPQGFVIGLDLLHIYPIEGAHVLGNTNFTLPESQEKVRKLLDGRPIDCVISDMAPNATGVRVLDQENIITLCYTVLRFAILMSSPNASLLVKVWDNGEVAKLEEDMSKFYQSVRHIKPLASRKDSAEKFLLAKGFKGRKIEPLT